VTAYQWCELTLKSNVELPELRRAGGRARPTDEWHIRARRGLAPHRSNRQWFHEWRFPDGHRWLSLARERGGYLVRFPGLVDFEVQPGAREIYCYRRSGTPLRTMRHLLLDQVLPLIAGGATRLALHASVVATRAGAVAFLGAAGHGKSTLAARLARRGCPLVSDDCCVLQRQPGGFAVAPSYPGVRLAPDAVADIFAGARIPTHRVAHYSSKRRIADPIAGLDFREGPLPLRRIYVLAPLRDLKRARTLAIRGRSAREGLLDLVNFTFHLDVEDPVRVRHAFELAADVAASCDVRLLTFPWNAKSAASVADAVLSDLAR
jgi:hypothetical protein